MGKIAEDALGNPDFKAKYYAVDSLNPKMDTFNKAFNVLWNDAGSVQDLSTYSPRLKRFIKYWHEKFNPFARM